ncbi:MAG: hypothetical protein Q9178_004021 [Gyalolechia marmorata]
METLAARLESFNVVHSGTKKRTSNAKGAAKIKWSHKSPHPTQLAKAGFFYNPKPSAPDNTTCYLCHNHLDGWEEDDDAFEEHANLSPGCGWAAIARIEQNIENGISEQADPTDERLLDARRMTFGTNWPHENKRGWICKTEKVRRDEHQRRSPDCIFFALATGRSKKNARGKKSRTSQASRVSTQSNLTTASEDLSMVDFNSLAETSMSANVESAGTRKIGKSAKKGTKGRKAAPKSKGKASVTQHEDVVVGSSFVEPEDDDFEIKIVSGPMPSGRGKKRTSDEMSIDNESTQPEFNLEHPEFPLPPPKRRATRSSVSYKNKAPVSTLEFTLDDDTNMEDGEGTAPPTQPASKMTGKRCRKTASSSVRKASTTSTATKASLRANVPNDEEIDAALEADLDRPLTDDEGDLEPPPLPKAKSRRLTRTRPGSRKVTASTAPVRRTAQAKTPPMEYNSTISTANPTNDSRDKVFQETEAAKNALNAMGHSKQEIIIETEERALSPAKSQGRASLKSTKSAKESEQNIDDEHVLQASQPIVADFQPVTQESSKASGSPVSDHLSARPSPMPEVHVGSITEENVAATDKSVLAPPTVNDGNAQTHVRGGGKKHNTAKRGKASKKGAPVNRESDNVIRVEMESPWENSPEPVVELGIPHADQVIEEATLPNHATVEEAPNGEEKAAKAKKGRPAKAKAKPRKPSTENLSIELPKPAEASPMATQKQVVDLAEEVPVTSQEVHDDTCTTHPQAATPQEIALSSHGTPKVVISPQSSDAENQPPSSRPSARRPPLSTQSPSKVQNTKMVLVATTPTASPTKRNISRLQSTLPWTSVDFEKLFMASPAAEKENLPVTTSKNAKEVLTSPEKNLTVEEWIRYNAKRGEDKLRDDCERLVGRFEGEGVRALKTLEGIVCAE